MKRVAVVIALFSLLLTSIAAQAIKVNPTGVNVNGQGATVVFLTFGPLINYVPAESCWCGEVVPAAPSLGLKCDPATVFGCLPDRYDLSSKSGGSGFTDIMSIPPSVARRAYQDAAGGAESRFFYVRRFVSTVGAPDQFVSVICRPTGGGARTPFALTDVKISFEADKPILLMESGQKLPPVKAEITYNGTGRLKGKWEVVLPGEEPPSVNDLLPEASLPAEARAQQRHYTQLSTFNVFLPPVGKYVLKGPDVSQLPNTIEGQYLVLLRIEASDDREGDSDLAAVGAGSGVVHSGAVAGFPMPPLRYFVGSRPNTQVTGKLALLSPVEDGVSPAEKLVDFSWTEAEQAAFYRLEIEDAHGALVLSALLLPASRTYRAPSWLKDRAGGGRLRWRVIVLDQTGNRASETAWRTLLLKRSN